jgi:Dolichyl-phosphate-mannose-protein mannosyltransferase
MLSSCLSRLNNAPDLRHITSLEKLRTGVGFALWFLLRAVWVWVHPWDSDEPQHLHVVWSWTQGLIPYRDFFDNHTPLFHFLCAPFLMAFGVRPDIIVWMRWLIVLLNAFILWIIYRIGKNVFSTRGGLLAALLCAFSPGYFFKIGEYRTDVLWTALWLLTLLIIIEGPMTCRRAFLVGLVMDMCLCCALKTVLLLLVVTTAALVVIAYHLFASRRKNDGRTFSDHFASCIVNLGFSHGPEIILELTAPFPALPSPLRFQQPETKAPSQPRIQEPPNLLY